MKLYFTALGHAMKLQLSRYVHLLSINQIFQFCHARVILCNIGEVYIFEGGLYISVLEHPRMLSLGNNVLLESINTIYKYCHVWVI